MLMTLAATLPGLPCSSNEAAASYGIALPVSVRPRAAPAARNRIAAGVDAMRSLRMAALQLLDVAHHVAVEHDPHIERPVDPLDLGQDLLVGHLDLDAEVLLLVDVDRLGEAERGHRRGFAMTHERGALRVRAGATREEPGGHLDHDLLADEQRRDGVEDDLADQVAGAIGRTDLLLRRNLSLLVERPDQGFEIAHAEEDLATGFHHRIRVDLDLVTARIAGRQR